MKKLTGTALLALGLAAAAPSVALAKDATATLAVEGWHCGGCSNKTEGALKKVKGVKSVTADFAKRQVVVAYDDAQTDVKAIAAAIQEAGYKASETKKN